MADDTATATDPQGLIIPAEIRKKFPDLVELVLGSESMNGEERQYWINILPVMTPDQLDSLRDILETEKKQLAAIDQKYAKEIDAIGSQELLKNEEEKRRKEREERRQKEAATEAKEEETTEALLDEIENQ